MNVESLKTCTKQSYGGGKEFIMPRLSDVLGSDSVIKPLFAYFTIGSVVFLEWKDGQYLYFGHVLLLV